MGNEMFQARLDDDFADRIHEYREKNHMNKSEAVRHLLRKGLEAESESDDATNDATGIERLASGKTVLFGAGIMVLGGLLLIVAAQFVATNPTLAIMLLGGSTLLMFLSLLTVWTAVIAQIALARPLRRLLDWREVST